MAGVAVVTYPTHCEGVTVRTPFTQYLTFSNDFTFLQNILFLSDVTWEGLAAPKPARLHTRFEPRSRVGGCM